MVLQALKYENEFISLLRLLRDKTFSKRGYSWTGKLLSSLLLTLTHTYPLENKFVNPEEWDSQGQHLHLVLLIATWFKSFQSSVRIIIVTGANVTALTKSRYCIAIFDDVAWSQPLRYTGMSLVKMRSSSRSGFLESSWNPPLIFWKD